MSSGFEENVAQEMPRSGKGGEPKTPWDVQGTPAGTVATMVPPAPTGRFPSLERGKSDVLQKIRDLKAELENAFASREDLQSKLGQVEEENSSLQDEIKSLEQERAALQDEKACEKEKRESAEKRIQELEETLQRQKAENEQIQGELSEARIALDEIYSALQ